MKKEKKLFLGLSIALGLLFILAVVSIIFVFVIDFTNTSENIMGTVYLFIHSLIIAVAFYYTFKAFMQKSQLMSIFMIDERGEVIKKSVVVASILAGVFLAIGVYFTLLCFNLNIPLAFFAKGIRFTLMNVGYSVGIVSLAFALYPKFYDKENIIVASVE